MKVIDLLVRRAHGEEVPPIFKIRYWKYDSITGNENVDYELFNRLLNEDIYLNDEVEIIVHTSKCDLPQHTCDLPQYKDWWQQEQEIKAAKEVARDYLKENIKLKEENKALKEVIIELTDENKKLKDNTKYTYDITV